MADDADTWAEHDEALELFERAGELLDEIRGTLGLEPLNIPDRLRHARRDRDWDRFLAGHPELTEPPPVTAADVLRALPPTIKQVERFSRWRRGMAWSYDIARFLQQERGVHLSGVAQRRHVARVADRLRRLADEGKVTRLYPRPPNHGHWVIGWAPAGVRHADLDDWVRREYLVDNKAERNGG
jgi:hypothetical protein